MLKRILFSGIKVSFGFDARHRACVVWAHPERDACPGRGVLQGFGLVFQSEILKKHPKPACAVDKHGKISCKVIRREIGGIWFVYMV